MKSILQGPKNDADNGEAGEWLGISETGRVVLFTEGQKGTLVYEPHYVLNIGVGSYRTDWCVNDFEPLKGKIILSN